MTSKSIFECSPVESVLLSDNLKLPLRGLIVLVGPNSSGKTNLLREIHAAASGAARPMLVSKEISLRSINPLDDYLRHFEGTGDIETLKQQDGRVVYRKRGHQYGGRLGIGGEWARNQLEDFYKAFKVHGATVQRGTLRADAFLANIGLLQTSALFIEERLTLVRSGGPYDTTAPPGSALQALRLNKQAQERFTEEMRRVFQRGAWLDVSGGQTGIRISDTDGSPPWDERLFPDRVRNYRTIDTEGEGVISYVAICVTLLLAQRPLCLIDEPEMCLHPPQARAIGRFIGKYGHTPRGCTLVATHSSHVLRGILETNQQVSVIRLTRRAADFRGQHVSSEVLAEATRKPLSRSEAILDGLFADGIVVCEADGDRLVYESTLQTLTPPLPDIRFIPVGGSGGIRDPVRLFRALNVPVAVAADLDVLARSELPKLLEELGMPESRAKDVSSEITECIKEIRAITPESSLDTILEKVRDFAANAGPWDATKEQQLRSQLNKLASNLNRLNILKQQGIDALTGALHARVKTLLNEFKKYGVFLVPGGELESWVPSLMSDVSSGNKSLWATEAARRIEDSGRGSNDIWDFVQAMVEFINEVIQKGKV